MKKVYGWVAATLICCSFATSSIAAAVIKNTAPAFVKAGSVVSIVGSGFGSSLSSSAVIANYGDGFSYALKVEYWSDHLIKISVPDLGKSLNLILRVNTIEGISNPTALHLIANLMIEHSPAYQHQLKVGDKGEEVLRIRNKKPTCGNAGTMFAEAGVHVIQQRFADARIVAMPKASCIQCQPVTVRWFNEPTGFIQYRIDVTKREIEGVCPDQTRNVSE